MIEQTCAEIASKASDKGYIIGVISGSIITSSLWAIYNFPELFFKRKRMFAEVSRLTKYNKGIVTVLDLVTAAEVSPEKASKFLIEFARRLDVEPEVEESTGTRFYRFVNGDRIEEYEREKKLAERYKS